MTSLILASLVLAAFVAISNPTPFINVFYDTLEFFYDGFTKIAHIFSK